MSTYKTGNAVGSPAVKDLFDNAQNLDGAVNDVERPTWLDRLGRTRVSIAGYGFAFDGLMERSEESLVDFSDKSAVALADFEHDGEDAIDRITTFVWRGIWMPGTDYAAKDTVTAFAARNPGDEPAMLQFFTMQPHRSSGDFNTDREAGLWNVDVGGVPRAELASPGGTRLVGFLALTEKAKRRSLESKLVEIGNTPKDIDTEITDQVMADWGLYGGDALPGGLYALGREIVVPESRSIRCLGDVKLDFQNASDIAKFPNGKSCFHAHAGQLVTLPIVVTDVSFGSNMVTFTEAPDLLPGDVLIVHDPREFSHNLWRSYYTAGEFVKVEAVIGTQVRIFGTFRADYLANDVLAYRLPRARFTLSGGRLHVIGSVHPALKALTAAYFTNYREPDVGGIIAENSVYASLGFSKCYDIRAIGAETRQSQEVTSGTDYGVVLANCHKGYFKGTFYGGRHAFVTGGGAGPGTVPCRDIIAIGHFANSPQAGIGIGAVNFHGNTEDCAYGGFIDGGFSGGGNHNKVLPGSTLIARTRQSGVAILLAEMVGTDLSFAGTTVRARGNPSEYDRGTIDMGGNSINALAENTKRGGKLNFSGMTVDAADSPLIFKLTSRRATPDGEMLIDLSGVSVTAMAASSVAVVNIQTLVAPTGSQFAHVNVRGLTWPSGRTFSSRPLNIQTVGVAQVRGWSRSGVATAVASTTANVLTFTVAYPEPAPLVAQPIVELDVGRLGTQGFGHFISAPGINGFTINIYTLDGTNFQAARVFNPRWSATVEQ